MKLPEYIKNSLFDIWTGPQPGLPHQHDETHAYVFSQLTGALEQVVYYSSSGEQTHRVHYVAAEGGEPEIIPKKVDEFQNGQWVHAGEFTTDGEYVQEKHVPTVMIGDDGKDQPIPFADDIFIVPSGKVIRLIDPGSEMRAARAEYVGQVKDFNPLKPFIAHTAYGTVPLESHRVNALINPSGNVFEFTSEGLRKIGSLAPQTFEDRAEIIRAEAPDFQLEINDQIDGPAVKINFTNDEARAFFARPLHKIVGRHPFLHDHIPEFIDANGGTSAEALLREIERIAVEIGFVLHTLQSEENPEGRAALMSAEHILTEKLTARIVEFESMLGRSAHSTVSMQSVRGWLETATDSPSRAIHRLARVAEFCYASESKCQEA